MVVLKSRAERIQEVLARRQPTLRVFMEEVVNEHNFSAILRTADAVGVLHVHYVHSRSSPPIHPRITQGTHHWLVLHREESARAALKRLRNEDFRILVTRVDPAARDFREVDYTGKVVVVVGNEHEGVSPEVAALADELLWIPMVGMARSLNVSVATALVLYEAFRQREAKGMYATPQLPEEEARVLFDRWTLGRRLAERGLSREGS